MNDIPYGATETYIQLAERLGRPATARAVGAANAANPISIALGSIKHEITLAWIVAGRFG